MGWISAQTLRQAIKDDLGIETMEAGPWDGICARAVKLAQADIRGVLIGMGYSAAQVESWDDLAAFHTAQGEYRALCIAGTTKEYDDKLIKTLDVRDSLRGVVLTTDDAAADPERVAERKTSSGTFKAGNFSMCDGDMDAWRRNRPGRSRSNG